MTQEKLKELAELIKKSAELGGLEQVNYIYEAGKDEGAKEALVNMNYVKETLTENIFYKTFKKWSREHKIPEYEFWEIMDGFRIPEDRHLEVFEKELKIKKYLFKK